MDSGMLERYSHLLDVRTPADARCMCFTKNYTRCATGAGSVLATAKGVAAAYGGVNGTGVAALRPRWFSVAEVARLHGFGRAPPDRAAAAAAADARAQPVLTWPAGGVSAKEKYQLLGNSMHVGVVQAMLMCLLEVSGGHR